MHLKALEAMDVFFPKASLKISFRKHETIHTENSHKYTFGHIDGFAALTGLAIKNVYSDDREWFSVVHFIKGG